MIVAVAFGAVAGIGAEPAPSSANSFRVVHLSDIHAAQVTRNPGPRFPGDPVLKDLVHSLEILDHAVRHINEHLHAELVVITGDLIDRRGDLDSLRKVKVRLDRLHCPYYTVIGNHDQRQTYEKVFPGRLNYTFDHRGWHFIALDSSTRTLEENTLQWLEADLAATRERPVVVMLHHPPASDPLSNYLARQLYRTVLALQNGAQLQELLKAYPNVRLVLSGHTHLARTLTWDGVCYSTAPGLVVAPHCISVLDISEEQIESELVPVYRSPRRQELKREQAADANVSSN